MGKKPRHLGLAGAHSTTGLLLVCLNQHNSSFQMEVSIVRGGTPVAGWFIRKTPSLNGWWLGVYPYLWNLQFFFYNTVQHATLSAQSLNLNQREHGSYNPRRCFLSETAGLLLLQTPQRTLRHPKLDLSRSAKPGTRDRNADGICWEGSSGFSSWASHLESTPQKIWHLYTFIYIYIHLYDCGVASKMMKLSLKMMTFQSRRDPRVLHQPGCSGATRHGFFRRRSDWLCKNYSFWGAVKAPGKSWHIIELDVWLTSRPWLISIGCVCIYIYTQYYVILYALLLLHITTIIIIIILLTLILTIAVFFLVHFFVIIIIIQKKVCILPGIFDL